MSIRVKEILINYRFYMRNAELLREDIANLESELDGIRGQDYSKDKITYQTEESSVEQLAIEIVEKRSNLHKAEMLLKAIDVAVEELEDIDKKIIKLKYMDRNTWNLNWASVARMVKYEKSWCRRRARKVMDKIEIVLKGIK